MGEVFNPLCQQSFRAFNKRVKTCKVGEYKRLPVLVPPSLSYGSGFDRSSNSVDNIALCKDEHNDNGSQCND
jgi:hypothetical protein